jgi:glycosyltransferase involved in cell wall biosynthesis
VKTKKTKILYLRTTPWFNLKAGGSVGHTSGVINALDKISDLTVISNDSLFGVIPKINIIRPLFKFLPIFGELLYNIKLIFRLKNVKQYNYIYQRHSAESFIGAYLSKKHHIPLILEFNSFEYWMLKNWGNKGSLIFRSLNFIFKRFFKLPLVRLVENYTLKHANYIIVVSDVLKQSLVDYGIDARKILVNPNGVDTEIYNPNINAENLKQELNINEANVIGFIGTFGEWHGSHVLAKAIVKLFDNYPERIKDTHFLLIGEGNQLQKVKDIINYSNHKNNITFTGAVHQSKGPEYLATCNILVSPHIPNPDGTAFFGSPTKLFEYMAMGKAIVASNLNQIGEILEHEKTALLIEPNDEKILAEALNGLIKNQSLQKNLGINARNEVFKNYTWDKHVEKIVDFAYA